SLLVWYDQSQEDWFAIEYIKQMRELPGKTRTEKFLHFVLSRTPRWIQITVLSLRFDSFVVTVLMRKGHHEFSGITRSDMKTYVGSFFVNQVYWIFVIGGGVSLLKQFRLIIF